MYYVNPTLALLDEACFRWNWRWRQRPMVLVAEKRWQIWNVQGLGRQAETGIYTSPLPRHAQTHPPLQLLCSAATFEIAAFSKLNPVWNSKLDPVWKKFPCRGDEFFSKLNLVWNSKLNPVCSNGFIWVVTLFDLASFFHQNCIRYILIHKLLLNAFQ